MGYVIFGEAKPNSGRVETALLCELLCPAAWAHARPTVSSSVAEFVQEP